MMKHRWILLVACAAAATTTSCVTKSTHQKTVDELYAAKAQLDELGGFAEDYGSRVGSLESEKGKLRSENSRLVQENAMLRANNQNATRQIDELKGRVSEMKDSNRLNIDGVELIQEAGALTYRVDGGVLFDPGKDKLKPSGVRTVEQIADQLKGNAFKIEIAGHTDTDPVKVTKDIFKRGNIELGASRALSVWDALRDAGLSEGRMRVASYGEYDPVGADKSKNRRVEIRVLLSEPVVAR